MLHIPGSTGIYCRSRGNVFWGCGGWCLWFLCQKNGNLDLYSTVLWEQQKRTGICMGIVACNGEMRIGNHGFMENERPVTTCSIFSVWCGWIYVAVLGCPWSLASSQIFFSEDVFQRQHLWVILDSKYPYSSRLNTQFGIIEKFQFQPGLYSNML